MYILTAKCNEKPFAAFVEKEAMVRLLMQINTFLDDFETLRGVKWDDLFVSYVRLGYGRGMISTEPASEFLDREREDGVARGLHV